MQHGVILCNGEFPRKEYPLYLLRTAGVIVCCDSRYNVGRLARLGLEPALIVGDMDSTPAAVLEKYAARIVQVQEQDDNDLAKAFSVLRERWPDVSVIHILGAGGKHEAHTVGNLGWLMEWERRSLELTGLGLASRGVRVDMVGDYGTAFAVSPAGGDPVELHVGEGRKVSLFSTDPALRVVSDGLVWQTEGADLSRWWAATLNRASSDVVTLRFNHIAPLLVILD